MKYRIALFVAAASAALILPGCSSSQSPFMQPCTTMDVLLKEKQELDAKVKKTGKEAREFRKQGDTASAASAEHRLEGMLENQRLLKESLEQSSRDCSPTLQDPQPVRDPATRDPAPK